jgi:AcrR family transcriptional regulator
MSPRTKQQLAVLKENRKNQILMASLELFSDKGYHNTAMSDIAKKAKLSKGLLYNYFDSKEQLLNEVVVMALKEATREGENLLNQFIEMPPKEIFKNMVTAYFLMLKEQKELWRLTISLAVQVSSIPSVHKTITLVYNKLLEQLEMLFTLLGSENPRKEALLLGAVTDGISIQYMIFGEEYPLEELQEMIINKYLKE